MNSLLSTRVQQKNSRKSKVGGECAVVETKTDKTQLQSKYYCFLRCRQLVGWQFFEATSGVLTNNRNSSVPPILQRSAIRYANIYFRFNLRN